MKKKSYLIGNAHLDPVWNWTWEEGYTEAKNTFQAATERLEEYDDFIFTASAVQYYKWVEERDPELFEKIKKYVQEGRWCITGGWIVQPDCNLPSGESFCRHSLYGQRYFLEKFGKVAETGYNVDSFGHNGNLPQILSKSGMKNYVFSRPGAFENGEIPSLFKWESKDGSSVLAYRIPIAYESNSLPELKEKIEKFEKLKKDEKFEQMLFYGVGNHGGGPTIEMLDYLKGGVNEELGYEFSSPNQYFDKVRDQKGIPTKKGELQRHATGCYSANSKIKSLHRQAENALISGEKYSVMANVVVGEEYKKQEFKKAWERLLFNEFHDVICGCSIKEASDDAEKDYATVIVHAKELANKSVQSISNRIDTVKGKTPLQASMDLGRPIVVFNPNTFETEVDVLYRRLYCNTTTPQENGVKFIATDYEGMTYPVQYVRGQNMFWKAFDGIFRAKVPALGYKLFYIKQADYADDENFKVYKQDAYFPQKTYNSVYGNYVMENEFIKVEIDAFKGGIHSLVDKNTGKEIFANNGCKGVVMDDFDNDVWGHDASRDAYKESNRLGVWGYTQHFLNKQVGEFETNKVKIVEDGEVRKVIRCVSTYGKSTLIQDFMLYKSAKELKVKVRLNLQDAFKIVKLAFPFALENPTSNYEIPYGFESRENDARENFGHKVVDLTDKNFGVSLINDGKYSFSVDKSTLYMVAGRSCIYGDHAGVREQGEEYNFIDLGEQEFNYSIYPHGKKVDFADIAKRALSFNTKYEIVYEGFHTGDLAGANSFISVDKENVLVKAIKQAEDGEDIVIRAVELNGKATKCGIKLFGKAMKLDFKPYEIKTVKVNKNGEYKETNVLEL